MIFLVFHLALFLIPQSHSSIDSKTAVAEYHYAHHSFSEALKLWSEILSKNPAFDRALTRVSELKLLLEGREAAKDFLLARIRLSDDLGLRSRLKQKLLTLVNRFETEEGQGLFFQGISKKEAGDCGAALTLFNRALVLEKGHLKVLLQKAACEKEARQFLSYYETLKATDLIFPFDATLNEALAEAHLYFRVPTKTIEVLSRDVETSLRRRVLQAYAILDQGFVEKACAVFLKMEVGSGAPPELNYATARCLSARGAKLEATVYWEKARIAVEKLPKEVWDPYHLAERANEMLRHP